MLTMLVLVIGSIPDTIARPTNLTALDLSLNQLSEVVSGSVVA